MTAAVCPGGLVTSPWASPGARLWLRADAPRADWLAARRQGIGSSDASAVLGLSKWTSPYEVWAEKRGLLPVVDEDNDAMEWGRRSEQMIADWWSETTGIPVRKAGLMGSRARPWQLASVDRLAGCGGLLEIKTLSWRVAEEWEDGQTPDHAEAQTQHQLAVTGRSHAHVAGLQDGRKPMVRTFARDDGLIADLNAIEEQFWSWVMDGTEPPIDGSSYTTDALSARWAGDQEISVLGAELADLVDRRRQWKSAVAEMEDGLGLLENQLRALLGDHTDGLVDVDDKKPLVTWRRNGAFSEKQLAARWPDLHAELQVPVQSTAVDVDRLKADHPDVYRACRARVLRVAAPPKPPKATEKKETP